MKMPMKKQRVSAVRLSCTRLIITSLTSAALTVASQMCTGLLGSDHSVVGLIRNVLFGMPLIMLFSLLRLSGVLLCVSRVSLQ
jgi:hypothetical protein